MGERALLFQADLSVNNHKITCADMVNQCFALKLPPEGMAWVKQLCEQRVFLWQEIAAAVAKALRGDQTLIDLMNSSKGMAKDLAKRRLGVNVTEFEVWENILAWLLEIHPDANADLIAHVLDEFVRGLIHDESTLRASIARYRHQPAP